MLDRNKNLLVVNSDEIDQKSRKYVRYETDIRLLKKLLMGPRFAHWNMLKLVHILKILQNQTLLERNVYDSMIYFHG